jgi:hypothetical protein
MSRKKWQRPEKGVSRTFVMKKENYVVNAALALPGINCLDLIEGLETGKLTKDTFVIVVEHSKINLSRIKTFLKKNFKKFALYYCSFQDLNLDNAPYAGQIYNGQIDFAFLDFCGKMNTEIGYWLNKNQHRFTKDAQVAYTFQTQRHYNKKLDNVMLQWSGAEERNALEVLLSNSRNNLADGVWNKDVNVIKIVNDFVGSRKKVKSMGSLFSTNVQTHIKCICMMLNEAFGSKNTVFDRVYRYKDEGHSAMVTIITHFNGQSADENDFLDVVKINDELTNVKGKRIMFFKERKTRKNKKKTAAKHSYMEICNIKCRKDLKKRGKIAYITRIAKAEAAEQGVKVSLRKRAILGGIAKQLTSMGK